MLLFVCFISDSLEYTINVVHRFTIDIKQKEEKKMAVQIVTERVVQMIKGELTGKSFTWMEILQGLCAEYKECYCKAAKENRKLLQIGFTITWAERTIICKDFTFELYPDMDVIYDKILDYFKGSVKDFGEAKNVSYYVVTEKNTTIVD